MKRQTNLEITLIALVITIMVLLILAGVTINLIIGDNGIIRKAKEAGRNYEEAAKYEEEQLAKLYEMIENPDKYNPDEIIGETENIIKDLQDQIDKLEKEKEEKENEIKKKDETIGELNQTIEDLRKQIENLENEKKELIANNNALQEEIASKDAQINELNKQIGELQNTISNLQEEIANKNNEIEELNRQIEQQQETIRNLQEQINNLNTTLSQTNATANQILTGKKAYSGGKLLTGTMPDRGGVSQTLDAGGSYIIPEGYHNGNGKVTAKDLASQTQATATASDIAQGKNAWVNGELIIGSGTNEIKMLSVMYNHEIDVETTTYVGQPTNGTYWHSSVSGNKDEWKYGTKSESQTNLIPLYKIDEKGKVYLLYSIDYYRNVSCTDHAGHFTGGLTVYLYDANGNEITSSSFGRCAVNQTHTNVKETFNLFEYIINTEAIYISFMLRCGGRESSDGPAIWSAGVVNKVDLTYYTAKIE